jgi:phage baseplate assembly protein W
MIDTGLSLGRGIAFPVNVGGDGRVAFSEGTENIREAIQIILMTELGERVRLVDFGSGLGRFLFEPNTTATQRQIQETILQSLATWEPRVTVDSVDVREDPQDPEAAIATITYLLVATQAQERVSVSVQVSG